MRIWFNKTFSSIHSVLRNLRQTDTEGAITLVFSHEHRYAPGMAVADEIFIEPAGLSGTEYLDWAIDFCRQQRIDLFWPGKEAALIAEHHARFMSQGTRVVSVADHGVLTLLNDKAAFYADLDHKVAVPPDSVPVNTFDEFDRAVALLRRKHDKLCVKPAISVFGLGFRVLDDARPSIAHLLKGMSYQIPSNELRFGMAQSPQFDTLLVMEYLSGHEWSVDCAASHGKLWCAVQRKKPLTAGHGQIIDNHPEIAGMVERLTAHYGLNGLFNIQFKEGVDGPRLLEINARPSGGFGMACLSGANLAKIALQAINNENPPRELASTAIAYGMRVGEVNTPVIVEEAAL